MNADLSIDYPGLRELVGWLVDAGVHGFTPCAVTAEAETMSLEEHRRVLAEVVDVVGGRVPVYCGIGRPSILETRGLREDVRAMSADGLFVIPPYASAHTLPEVSAYFADVVRGSGLPTIMYNAPGYATVNIPPTEAAALAQIPEIVGCKEGNQAQLHDTVRMAGHDMSVLTARDSYLLPSLAVGARGIVSFAANVEPELVVALYEAAGRPETDRARTLHEAVSALVEVLVSRSYPVMIKAAVAARGLPAGPARRAGGAPSDAESQAIDAVLAQIKALA